MPSLLAFFELSQSLGSLHVHTTEERLRFSCALVFNKQEDFHLPVEIGEILRSEPSGHCCLLLAIASSQPTKTNVDPRILRGCANQAWRRHAYARKSVSYQSGALTAVVGIFLFHPTIPKYPKAKFPGVVVFSEIYQGKP